MQNESIRCAQDRYGILKRDVQRMLFRRIDHPITEIGLYLVSARVRLYLCAKCVHSAMCEEFDRRNVGYVKIKGTTARVCIETHKRTRKVAP